MTGRQLEVGDVRYEICTSREGTEWRAYAMRGGDRFGVEVSAAIEAEAIERLTVWLKWQHAHGEALATLQQAEQAYHRALAVRAFTAPRASAETPEASDLLAVIGAARANLDIVRARKPQS